jgi:hypothetical protein
MASLVAFSARATPAVVGTGDALEKGFGCPQITERLGQRARSGSREVPERKIESEANCDRRDDEADRAERVDVSAMFHS